MNFNKRQVDIDELTFDAVLSKYPNKSEYRVNKNIFEPGDGTTGISRAGTCYIIEGKCTFIFNNKKSINVEAGEMFSFPESNYEIIADDNLGVKYSMVWNLKEILKKNETHT